MATKLKITKKDGSIHYVANTAKTKAFWESLNKLYGKGNEALIEEVDGDDIDTSKWRDKDIAKFSLAGAKELADKLRESESGHAEKDTKIAELEARLAQLNQAPTKLSAADAIAAIRAAATKEDVAKIMVDETRATVIAASEARLAQLNQ